jgi:hypothetical protein
MAKVADAVIVCALVLVLDMAAGLLGLVQAARNQQVRLQKLYICNFFQVLFNVGRYFLIKAI